MLSPSAAPSAVDEITQLYLQHRTLLFYVAARKFGVPETDCEPLIQEALCSYCQAGHGVENPRAWLVAAVCNGSRRYWRDRARTGAMESAVLDARARAAEDMNVDRLERELLVQRLLKNLRPRDRTVLRLHYFEGQTATELARTLGTTAGYAGKLIVKALARARFEYQRLDGMSVARSASGALPTAPDGMTEGEYLTRVGAVIQGFHLS